MLYAMMNKVAVFITGLVIVKAQIPFLGSCPDVQTMPDFNLNQFLGKWFESERYFAVFEFGGKCVTAEYNLGDSGAVTILNKQMSSITGLDSSIEGVGNVVSRDDAAKLTINFPSLPYNFDAPYWVLDTDYKNYAVVWSCNDFGIFNTRNAWILARSKNPTLPIIQKAYTALKKNGISRAYFIKTDQKNCPLN
ncbi:unnamed protein product [Brassicogethes aeneus]|uniref:Lipocalin/cytosolic fatty-acid binding domain-containing protein n=1 Tax=Brassicogethes aeneus TaxID=1431903 RepID=A0A9P0BF89_BRAAE|nr:unnamed protein product [Brassicogethes aeneus]